MAAFAAVGMSSLPFISIRPLRSSCSAKQFGPTNSGLRFISPPFITLPVASSVSPVTAGDWPVSSASSPGTQVLTAAETITANLCWLPPVVGWLSERRSQEQEEERI